jgi:hypothetical protein
MASNSEKPGRGARRSRTAEIPAPVEAIEQPAAPGPAGEPSPHPPFHYRLPRGYGTMVLRETCTVPTSWPALREPVAEVCDEELLARSTLEQVGNILRRLAMDQREIDHLRLETRSILEGLAA